MKTRREFIASAAIGVDAVSTGAASAVIDEPPSRRIVGALVGIDHRIQLDCVSICNGQLSIGYRLPTIYPEQIQLIYEDES